MSHPSFDIRSLKDLKKVGHITPSSNTALEPLTALMNADLTKQVSHHFARLRVRQMTLDSSSSSQFDFEPMLNAAELLADAPMDALVWNGTSASWLGLDRDEELCKRITERTGIAASTSTLAFHESFKHFGFTKIGMAVPYTQDLTQQIVQVYRKAGIETVSQACLGQSVNTEVGNNDFEAVRQVLRDADSPEAECIAVVCTNFPATSLVEEMERELGKPIIDSIAVTFWKGCRMVGIEPRIEGWGRLLRGA
ncbi:Asp/Glu/hydantoin racemase [Telmatospirillum sp. J64-1]|uniref:maleate cis-trans isomerase family protein n=1 Tax=Telmatospirillum sp. J64-1 TaxID=2502183 RepID=UPI00115F09FA|nr:Asp/Glu/hydantoin racemase [Telmatospirillum sp. J64-1]